MKLGLFAALFNQYDLDGLLQELEAFPDIRMLEVGTGGWPGDAHLTLDLLNKELARNEVMAKIADRGLSLSALSCHGNPLHPQEAIAQRDHDVLVRTIELASILGVQTVVTFSGCPGGSPEDRTPNWVTVAWPPEFAQMLEWQWSERLIPYWKGIAKLASSLGVRIALEAHPGFCVYNPETLLKLRSSCGESIGINLDPSHLWWQGVDIPTAIRELGDAIFHFHAKDVALDPHNCARNGVIDSKSYVDLKERSWTFRSVGWGHGELEWKSIISALRIAGYDGVLSIEHEDALASISEGLSSAVQFLSRIILQEPPAKAWWV